ncbi:hypothetical protein JRO89_XS03G0278400 [Xanthoceras sorbifolium]|uniref:Uncharacterized protein n=1 Tax=Xanthoceras sorbifolium TaxID=99658 RepID=A0ABQ8ICB0_9ROSI|nr:hypothetical protein JRO89_XS03G0278400 [Xanthoceras sorbifolium]
MIEDGVRWRVGNGAVVSLYGDRWLPCPNMFKVLSQPLLGVATTVILAIPPSVSRLPDSLCWHFDSSGEFSVKSGYLLDMSMERMVGGSKIGSLPIST